MLVELNEKEYAVLKKVLSEAIAKRDEDGTYSVDLDADKFQRRVSWDTSNDEMLDMIFAYLKEEKGLSDKFCNFWRERCRIKNPGGSGTGGHGYMDFGQVKKSEEELEAEKKNYGYVWNSWNTLPDYKIEGRTFADLGEQCYERMVKMLRNWGDHPSLVNINEAEEPAYMRGELNYFDRKRMAAGKPPIWAKSMKDIGPRKKELRQSSSYSEIAMLSANTPNGEEKKPYTEGDWRRDKENAKAMNQNIADKLKEQLGDIADRISADDKEVSVVVGNNYVFRVSPRGAGYYVLRFAADSIFDRKNARCANLADVVKFIEENK